MTAGFESRVTIDLDGDVRGFEMVAVRTYHNLRRVVDRVDVHVSSGGEGLHLVGYTDDRLDVEQRITMRRALNDDRARISFDIERAMHGLPIGVMWDRKAQTFGKGVQPIFGTKDRDFSTIWDALDHIDATTTDPSDRMAALADQGHKGAPDLARKAEAHHA